jgi:hypothetical protein
MGPGLADGISQGQAGPDEFRTTPLWGVGQRIFFLHDERTSDLLQAIMAHASNGKGAYPPSEANAVISRFQALSDYQSATNFKYAGIDVTNNVLRIGQRTTAGWIDLATLPVGKPALGLNQNNTLLLTADGTTATLSLSSATATNSQVVKLSYTFSDPLNDGAVGVGTKARSLPSVHSRRRSCP